MDFDLTTCSTIVGYSTVGELYCVHSSSNSAGTIDYVVLYNTDVTISEPTTYRFTCMAYKKSGSTVQLTQSPKKCQASQSITAISSPGSVLVFTPSVTCVPTTTTPTSKASVGAMAAGISFAVIVLIILIVVFCVFFLGRDRAKRFKCKCGRPTRGGCLNCVNSFLRGLQVCGTRSCVFLGRTKICCLRFWKACCDCQTGKVDPGAEASASASGELSQKHDETVVVQVDDNKIGVPFDRDLISPSNLIIQETDGETSVPRRLPPIESPRKVDEVDSAEDATSQHHSSKLPPISETDNCAASEEQTEGGQPEEKEAPETMDNSPYGGKTAPESIDPVTPRITE
ncbi:uncharacterized protein LOC121374013 [Gigantopelta aegis]|uniref:uncharacterized protein LOC121374013 n=1 Tax=Gigantopelta aegis TaxID=1735272 RepID=UPI001B88CD93|nr:uncharacterized protein LOC121374013 [Gigantopelta aegis]